MVELAFWMIVAHFVADFPLQGDFLALNKGKRVYLMVSHSMIWAGILCIPLKMFGMFSFPAFAWLFIGHGLIDWWKTRMPPHFWMLYIDQFCHAMQIFILLMWHTP